MNMSAPNESTPYATAAQAYLDAGWPAPLPVQGKYPPPRGWTGVDGAWPSGADVWSWTEDRGGDNIGLRLPPTVLGVDVDNYSDKRGKATLAECEAAWGELPTTWRSTSRDDGTSGIRLFTIPEGLSWPGQLPGGGVDLVKWDHRYCMAWPSIHPNGGTYRWTRDGITTIHGIPRPDELPALPVDWILGLMKGRERHDDKADIVSGASWVTGLPGSADKPCAVMAGALARACAELSISGNRHDDMCPLVQNMVRLAEAGHPGGITALDDLGEWYVGLITERDSEPVVRREYVRALNGACAVAAASPSWPPGSRGDPCTRTLSTVTSSVSGGSDFPGATTDPATPATMTSWGAKADVRAALDGRLPSVPPSELARSDGVLMLYPGKVNALLGPSESGKTWLALLGASQAMQAGRSVVFLDFEDTVSGLVGRLRALGVDDELIDRHLVYLAPDEPLTMQGLADLQATVKETAPSLIILDGVNAAMTTMGLDLVSNKDATLFHLMLLLPLSKSGAAVVVVDHTPKNDAEGLSKGGIGAQAKRAAITGASIKVEVVTQFSRAHVGLLKLTVDKDRGGHVRMATIGGVIGMAHLEPGDDGTLSVRIEPQESAVNEAGEFRPTVLMERVADYLADNPGANVRDLMRAHLGKDKYVRDAIDYLVQDGHVSRTNGPNRQVLHTLIRVYPASVAQVQPGVAAPGVSGGVARGGTEYPPPSHTNAVGTHLRNSHTQDPPEFDYGDDPADE